MDLVTFLIRKYYTCNGSLIEICLMVIMWNTYEPVTQSPS
jgi:hypothetical protein